MNHPVGVLIAVAGIAFCGWQMVSLVIALGEHRRMVKRASAPLPLDGES